MNEIATKRMTFPALASAWLTIGLFGFSEVPAAQWELQPQIDVGSRFETNPRLARDKEDEDDATGLIAEGLIRASYKTERSSLSLAPRYRFGYYDEKDLEDLEDRDLYVVLDADHKTQLHSFSLDAEFSDVGIRRNNIAGTDENGDVNFNSEDRERWTVTPGWEYQVSPRFLIGLSGSYQDVKYDRDESNIANGRFDYDYTTGQVSLIRVLDEKSRLSLNGTLSSYESGGTVQQVVLFPFPQPVLFDIKSTSDTSGASLTYTRALTNTLEGTLQGGLNKTDIETDTLEFMFPNINPVTLKSDATNFTGLASLQKFTERTTYTITASRAISPNSRGGEVISDRFNASMRHKFSRLIDVTLGLTAFQQEDVSEGAISTILRREQKYAQGLLDIGWRLSRNVSIRGSYRFTWVEDDSNFAAKTDATNHNVYVRLVYRPTAWRN